MRAVQTNQNMLTVTLLHLSASSLAKLGEETHLVCSLIQEGTQALKSPTDLRV